MGAIAGMARSYRSAQYRQDRRAYKVRRYAPSDLGFRALRNPPRSRRQIKANRRTTANGSMPYRSAGLPSRMIPPQLGKMGSKQVDVRAGLFR